MKFEVPVEIPFPRERVWATYRDRLPELVKYLPNVRAIEQKSRTEEGGVVKLVNHWKGGGDIPAVARSFLSEKLLEWDDYATWKADSFVCEWRDVVEAFKDALNAHGTNTFDDVGGSRTRMTIRGEIVVDAGKIKAVPRLLAGTVGPAVEKFLVATIKPNLVSVAEGVGKFLAANP